MDDLIVNFAPTGMIPQKNQTPHVPVTPQEIVADVKEACKVGVTMVHLHIRDGQTHQPCYKKETYAKVISGIREFAPDLILCVSTSGRTFNDFEKRADVLGLEGDLKPDMASLTLSSLNFNNQASLNEPELIRRLAARMKERGVKPELEAFDAGMINYAHYLIKKNLLDPPYYFNLILGNIACAQADLLHAGVMVKDLPAGSLCSMGGVGESQLRVNSLAISMGFGVRVGLEDNIWYDGARTRLATNPDLLRRVASIAEANGRGIMRPAVLREKLGLAPGSGSYGERGEA